MGNMDDMMSAAMEFLGVINSVYAGLFLMPFLVLNIFSFPPTAFFILKTDSFGDFICLHTPCAENSSHSLCDLEVTSMAQFIHL